MIYGRCTHVIFRGLPDAARLVTGRTNPLRIASSAIVAYVFSHADELEGGQNTMSDVLRPSRVPASSRV